MKKYKSHDLLVSASAVTFLYAMFRYVSELVGFISLSVILFVAGAFIAKYSR